MPAAHFEMPGVNFEMPAGGAHFEMPTRHFEIHVCAKHIYGPLSKRPRFLMYNVFFGVHLEMHATHF